MIIRASCFLSVLTASVLLSGCAGMNSDFEFDKPARDSGIWMSQADDMTVTNNANATRKGTTFNLTGYRLINNRSIRLDVKPAVSGGDTSNRQTASVIAYASAKGSGMTTAAAASSMTTVPVTDNVVLCNTPRCYPEPASAFRTPDAVVRIWIAPFVSPEDNVHMGEIVYSVAKSAHWNGIM